MAQQQISGPAGLRRQCISSLIEHLRQLGRTNSIKNLPLPSSVVQEMEDMYQYQQDLDVLISSPPFDRLPRASCADIPNKPPFNDHFRWMRSGSMNGSFKIDHRATAAAQLDNLDPTKAPRFSIVFGFVLAATFGLEDHIRRLLPCWNSHPYLSSYANPIIAYWTDLFRGGVNAYPNVYLWRIRPQPHGSSDFWLAVVRSFWPIADGIGGVEFQYWIKTILRDAMKYRYKSIVDFVWAHPHADDMRRSLVMGWTNGNYDALRSAIRENEHNILVDILERFENDDARRATIAVIVDEICKEFKYEKYEYSGIFGLLCACVDIDQGRFSTEFAKALCESLSSIWPSIMPSKRRRVLNNFVDFLRYAVEFARVELVINIWTMEEVPYQKFEMLFRDECAVFRASCANGHLELVQLFWEWASNDQRCSMIRCKYGDALNSASRNGHISVVRYLWENMDPQLAYEAIGSCGIYKHSLSQLIIANSTNINPDGTPHELECFLSMLISNPSDVRERELKGTIVAALLLDNGKALHVLVQRAKDSGDDPPILRSLMDAFDNEQRARLCSTLSAEVDIRLCGLELAQIVAGMQAMAIQRGTGDEEEKEENDGEGDGEEDEDYYDGFVI